MKFESSDIYLCAFLTYNGATLEDVKGEEKKTFVLDGNNLKDYVNDYWSSREVSVVPSKLFSSLRFLKSALHRA